MDKTGTAWALPVFCAQQVRPDGNCLDDRGEEVKDAIGRTKLPMFRFRWRTATVPADNIYHQTVVTALTADGWVITDDPYTLSFGGRDLFVDLAAEQRALTAEKSGRRIAVEILVLDETTERILTWIE